MVDAFLAVVKQYNLGLYVKNVEGLNCAVIIIFMDTLLAGMIYGNSYSGISCPKVEMQRIQLFFVTFNSRQ